MFLILILIFPTLIDATNLNCAGQCYFATQNDACIPNNQNSVYSCQPTTYPRTPVGCTTPPPLTTTLFCSNCIGAGIICPTNCIYNKNTNTCDKTRESDICQPIYHHWKCPENCVFDNGNKTCIPTNLDIICEYIPGTVLCPNKCTFNECQQTCLSFDVNIVCGATKGLVCPLNCRNNINGQHCITSGQNVCEYTTIPVCMPDCSFNFTKNRCMPNTTTLSDCEPIIRLSQCPSNFTYNISVPMCDKFNTDDICIKNQIIQYPERLKNKYSNIGCVYKVHLNCSAMVYGTITGCPAGCNLDTFYNNCRCRWHSLFPASAFRLSRCSCAGTR